MRALRYDTFGPVATAAHFVDVPPPVPHPGEVLVRVRFASINPLDWKLVEGQFRRLAKSKPPAGIGTEFGGTVEAHGSGVATPPLGANVVGFINPFARAPGVLQEYVAVAAGDVVAVDDIDLAVACTLPCAGLSGLQMCRMAHVAPGQRVLITGAAGGVGSFAVQIVRALGALPFACAGHASQATLTQLAPHAQIDYEKQTVATWGGPFDAVLDCANALSDADVALLLAGGGYRINTLPKFPAVIFDSLRNPFRRIRRATLRLNADATGLRTMLQWLHEGRVRPLILERFAFGDARAALERSKTGHARGKLVVEVG